MDAADVARARAAARLCDRLRKRRVLRALAEVRAGVCCCIVLCAGC